MKENELYLVKQHNFDKPLFTEIESLVESCLKDCYHKYFHKIKCKCIYDDKLINITDFETIYLTISRKSMNLYDVKKTQSC